MYIQNLNPTGSLTMSALLASLPLLALLVALGGFKWRAHWAGAAALLISIGIAIAVYHMPLIETLNAGVFGAAVGVLAILWITFNAIWIYNLTVKTGHFAVLRRAFAAISDDRRIQSIVIAFSFGGLLEALAGGGSPIAICGVMLIAIGFNPLKAATVALVANTAPVAFGALGNPINILAQVTDMSAADFGAMAGRQVSLLAIFVPLVLVGVVDGWKGVREVWPAALTCGLSFGIAQFVFSNFVNYKLCDIFGALISAAAVILLNKVWQPRRETISAPQVIAGGAGEDPAFTRRLGPPGGDTRRDILLAFAPYAVVVVLFSLAQLPGIRDGLNAPTVTFDWPGLHILSDAGKPVSVAYKLNWLAATGTLLFLSGLVTMLVLRIKPSLAVKTYVETLRQFGWAIVTILLVFALSYVMNLSGQVLTLGIWLAQTGAFFAFLSPVVGWFGVAVTGTDAGSNALFAKLQITAAQQLHASPILFGAANSSGGVMAKMISPQSLAIGTAAVGAVGSEGILFRRVFGWSVLFLLAMCVLVFLQSTPVLGWMRVGG
ncbi:MAG TPA: L-lactate permease [Pseudonocardia sp.]|nr:L-lactate permease [Pseudonocardia sp.]